MWELWSSTIPYPGAVGVRGGCEVAVVKHYLILEPVGGRGVCEGAVVKHFLILEPVGGRGGCEGAVSQAPPYLGSCRRNRRV